MKQKASNNVNEVKKARRIIRELWKRGNLDYKLHAKQLELKKFLLKEDREGDMVKTVLCARQFGKTHLLVSLAIEVCNQKKGAIVIYVCPSLKQAKQNIDNVLRELLKDAPEEFMPTMIERMDRLVFPNGSYIQLGGTDNKNHETLRGRTADMCIVDEAGFADELSYVVNSILMPTVQRTGGSVFLVSTPSKLYSHDFIQNFVIPEKAAGRLKIYTMHDNPQLTEQRKNQIVSRYIGGEEHPEFRREYLCEIIQDRDSVVIPEFDEESEKEIVREVDRPAYYDIYVAGDVGFKDLTAYLFGYWDWKNARLVIEDELVLDGTQYTTDSLAGLIRAKEYHLYQMQEPYLRIMDIDHRLIQDFQVHHNLFFVPTEKDNKEAAINQVRMLIAGKQIVIHPRCKNLIYQLKNATWDKNHKKFERIGDSLDKTLRGGHADAVDALIYLARNVDRSKNPYPSNWSVLNEDYIQPSRLAREQDEQKRIWARRLLNIRNK